jgi:hypothetical protein
VGGRAPVVDGRVVAWAAVPTFCRHNRFIERCPICSKDAAAALPQPPPRARTPRSSSPRSGAPRRATAQRAGSLRVRREVRGPVDDFASPLVPGLRSSVDAGRLADELAFSAGRLERLASDPPGLYAEAGAETDRDEALWLLFLIAHLSPLEAADPWTAIAAARTPWAAGEGLPDGEALVGPRASLDPAAGDRAAAAYRAWAERSGGLSRAWDGEAAWTPERRFGRLWERLALPGFHRAARFDMLTTAGRLGVAAVVADGLHLGGGDPVTDAAKRVFGIGDPGLLDRRARDLAEAAGVPLDALDLALWNFGIPGRVHLGADDDVADPEVRAATAAALGLEG